MGLSRDLYPQETFCHSIININAFDISAALEISNEINRNRFYVNKMIPFFAVNYRRHTSVDQIY